MRNPGIELYRCLLMLGICILHVIGYYDASWQWLSYSFMWCVTGFVFITGFFGCTFDVRKLLKLYGVALWCFPVSRLIACGLGMETFSWTGFLLEAWRDFLDNWFIHAYVVLLVAAPYVDAYLRELRESGEIKVALRLVVPLAVLVFVWSWAASYNFTAAFVPRTSGLTAYSSVTLVGIYALARIVRFCGLHERIPTWAALLLFPVCLGLSMLKLGVYNSPIAFGAAFAGFVLCWRLPLPRFVATSAGILGPSMFSVFLLHTNGWVLPALRGWSDGLVARDLPLLGAFVVLVLAVYVGGILLDFPRRVLLALHRARKARI